ncbi:DNA-protecting protein DprA [Pseudomonas cichorii]|nr:DNA-protecting protein DprA [Pseudomonas cichorii]MBX8521872.1 DNA-protecting protein DprA [Pseudomonas cichorii]MBX8541673.1 DNA-protecting protein DprA [Pseudomonas cichorii]MBX8546908.1 DNA-protecting protein DprA [Pseudomonas cichorii]MBX8567352.1 DNA-protecting protein DprA [Pseudomonas cichorii]
MMNTNNQAILLLTCHFSKSAKNDVKPLSPTEWGRFALWLNEQGSTPASLLSENPRTVLHGWSDAGITLERIEQLLNRGHALAFALEKWSRAGIWVLTRSDNDYPKLLKQRLRTAAPAVLFGCGNASLLNQLGISVVGSRNASHADLDYARTFGQHLAQAGLNVISGAAKGIDEESMLGGLEGEGSAVGVMADSLFKAATSSKWRQGLMAKKLVLVSPFSPEAGFNAGNAMARNKYIYCMSQASVVVHSGHKGGTWTGAVENLKKSWVPLWVHRSMDTEAGNPLLVNQGGQWLNDHTESLDVRALLSHNPIVKPVTDLLTSTVDEDEFSRVTEPENQSAEYATYKPEQLTKNPDLSFYQVFLLKLENMGKPVTVDDLVEEWAIPKTLINTWLKQSIEEGRVKKLKNPIRYEFSSIDQLGLSLQT